MEIKNPAEIELKEKVVQINRVAKVVKGGRRFSFNAIVVVGNGDGIIGAGLGKANEVVNAITKGVENARKTLFKVSIINGTITHDVTGKYGSANVFMKPASPGTGIIAGGPVRAIMELAGIQNILTKSIGTSNPHNVVKATLEGLKKLLDAYSVARKKGIPINQIYQ
ncbi:30S ribosomal protein S5 [candidate division KSB1 bacterium]|nr:30S ribosomal protein S5 [candidate division KSB1 bacterium]